MAFSLNQLTKPTARPIIATIVGEHGLGKTSLAAMFPAPVVIRTEDGLSPEHQVETLPVADTVADVFEQVNLLGAEDHAFKTLVLDSITQLNTMIEAEIVKADSKAKSIATAAGGYGAGYAQAADMNRQVREICGQLSSIKQMNVVFIGHADNETIDPPDAEPYSRYTVRMNKRSVCHYSDNVDLVAFVKLQTSTFGGDRSSGKAGKATTTGQRIITCYPTPNHVSKNRFGIDTDLVFERGTNPFAPLIPQLSEA
jgi:hypothetical protein